MRIGIPAEYFGEGMDAEVRRKVESGIEILKKLRCKTVNLSMPHTDYAIAAYYIVANAEASSNLARFDGVRYGLRVNGSNLREMYEKTRGKGFGAEVKRRIMLGTYVLSSGYYDAYYLRAQKVRSLITRDFTSAFEKVDVIVTPTSPSPAFRIGERMDDPLAMYLSDIYTVTGDLAGIPGISVPCGTTSAGLPIGLQIFSSPFGEARILQLAVAFENKISSDDQI
jgi:aspartyl-tRNA(Asn)/glutamyl-tRNA(Gln) amidotransferase subunit A